jgi:hypothetical protein
MKTSLSCCGPIEEFSRRRHKPTVSQLQRCQESAATAVTQDTQLPRKTAQQCQAACRARKPHATAGENSGSMSATEVNSLSSSPSAPEIQMHLLHSGECPAAWLQGQPSLTLVNDSLEEPNYTSLRTSGSWLQAQPRGEYLATRQPGQHPH